MDKLINAPYAKRQDPTGESLVTICLGIQALTIADFFNKLGQSADEIVLSQALGDGDTQRYPCVVVDDESLENIEHYRIAPKKTRAIRLICANNGQPLSEEMKERVIVHLVKTTQAQNITYCNEAGGLSKMLAAISNVCARIKVRLN